ncbi:MAG: hypothetical protein J7507_08930, partial [Pseudoxanthomonas sp.]|nr:hypothetical protein [Pseudoxanthomonas sp.]
MPAKRPAETGPVPAILLGPNLFDGCFSPGGSITWAMFLSSDITPLAPRAATAPEIDRRMLCGLLTPT